MALGQQIAGAESQLGQMLVAILDKRRRDEDQLRRLRLQQTIQKILQDAERKSIEHKQKVAKQQQMTLAGGALLASAFAAPLLSSAAATGGGLTAGAGGLGLTSAAGVTTPVAFSPSIMDLGRIISLAP